MAKYLGDKVEARTTTIGLPDPNEATSVGDAVALDADGNCVPYDGDAHDALVGIRPKGDKSADNIPVVTHGVVIGTVATGTAAGAGAGGGNTTNGTTGAIEGGGNRGTVLSDEGGTYKGSDLPADAAAVDLF